MLRIWQHKNLKAAKDYYLKGLATQDYYTREHGLEHIGGWHGKGAERLGVKGAITQKAFFALLENRHPITGERLTARTREGRTLGYDFTWDVPKSVSIVHAIKQDQRILEAFERCVQQTMRDTIEIDAQTRVRKGGLDTDRPTGNLIWADFTHLTTRPANATGLPDPHLHSHCFVMNATFDHQENQWKAGQFRDLVASSAYYNAVMHTRLARELQQLGYGIERRGDSWEIAAIERPTIEKFSHRTKEINEEAKRRQILDPEEKGQLGARMRRAKETALSPLALRDRWQARLFSEERQAIENACDPEHRPFRFVEFEAAKRHALDKLLARASTTRLRSLHTEILKYGVGVIQPEDLHHLEGDRDLIVREINGKAMVTTPQVLAEEKTMVAFARDGRGQHPGLGPKGYRCQNTFLNTDQKRAVESLLGSPDTVMALRGSAGVGKTTLMHEVVDQIHAQGRRVVPLAPTAKAAREVLLKDGFKGANTVQAFLNDDQTHRRLRDQVVWIDEAGQMGTRLMSRVFQLAETHGFRVILSGDARQHASVERGDALRILQTQAGIVPAEVKTIVRQKNQYKKAVGLIAAGEVERGFKTLDQMQAIREIPDAETRYAQLVRAYLAARDQGHSTLVVSPTNLESDHVTKLIRAALKDRGNLKASEARTVPRLASLNLTEAERQDVHSYEKGLILHFHTNAKGFRAGDKALVLGQAEDGRLLVRNIDRGSGRTRAMSLEPGTVKRFSVHREVACELAPGDLIRITKGGSARHGKHRLNNGMTYQLAGFTKDGDLELTNGWVIDRRFGHINHGYCSTSYSSQGRSVKTVLIAQSTASEPAASLQQFYVSTSRGVQQVQVFTDDKERLLESIKRMEERLSATELMAKGKPVTTSKQMIERAKKQRHQDAKDPGHIFKTPPQLLGRGRGRGRGRNKGRGMNDGPAF